MSEPRLCFHVTVAAAPVHTEAILRIRYAAAFAAFLTLSACSSGPSRQEYATSVESLLATMVDQLIEASNRYCGEQGTQDEVGDCANAQSTMEDIRAYVNQEAAARQALVEGLALLEPPQGFEEFHDAAVRITTRLAAAEAELAAVAEGGTFESLDALLQTPEGQRVADAVDEGVALCEAAQADFDTVQDAQLAGTVWIPSEMREVVVVAFRCRG